MLARRGPESQTSVRKRPGCEGGLTQQTRTHPPGDPMYPNAIGAVFALIVLIIVLRVLGLI